MKQLGAVGDELCLNVAWQQVEVRRGSGLEMVWEPSHFLKPSGAVWIRCSCRRKAWRLCAPLRTDPLHFPFWKSSCKEFALLPDDGAPSSVRGAGTSDGDPFLAESSPHRCPQFGHPSGPPCPGAQGDSESQQYMYMP